MSFNFPINPSLNQTYSVGDKTWIYDGRGWKLSTLQFSVVPIYNHANGAFDKANSANSLAQAAFDAANSAGSSEEVQTIFAHANGAFDQANLANVLAQAGFDSGNATYTYASSGYGHANGAFEHSNSVFIYTNSAFNVVNTSSLHANAAFDKANAANVLAQAAFDKANTDVTSISTTAGTYGTNTVVPVISVVANGRVLSVSNTAIAFPVTSVGGNTGVVTNQNLLDSIKQVDGPGSGLDADLLDGITSASFLRSDQYDTFISLQSETGINNLLVGGYSNTYIVSPGSSESFASQPMATEIWHDLFAFTKHYTTTFETSNGSVWSSATLDRDIFSQKENISKQIINGTSILGARWTFTNTAWGSARWLVIGHAWSTPTPSKTILVESSTDQVTWTTRHNSTYTDLASSMFHRLDSYSGDAYLRVTITWNSGGTIQLSNMKLLTSRPGDQGKGKEFHFPYTWDGNQNITTGNNLYVISTANTVWHAGNDGVGSGLDADLLDGLQGGSYANSNFSSAAFQSANNTANVAQAAYNFANTRYSSSGGTISGDVQISGNLIIVGNTVTHSANDFIVNDPIVLIANNNAGNIIDIGFVGHYKDGGANTKHTGLIRDVSTNTWYLFESYEPHVQETNVLNIAHPTLVISNLRANVFGNANTANDADTLDGLQGISYANSIFTQSGYNHANGAFNRANTDVTSISTTAGTYGSSTVVPVIALEANGRIRSITNTSITFPAETDTLQSVTARGNTSDRIITLSNTTKTTSNTTGSLLISGGIAVTGNVALQQIFFADGTTMNTAAFGSGGGASLTWTKKTANYTANVGDRIIADTSTGPFTITLPATPTLGSSVTLADGNNWYNNNLTVARNGSTIEGMTEDLILDIEGIQVDFVYDGTTWEIYTFSGPSPFPDPTGNTGRILTASGNLTAWSVITESYINASFGHANGAFDKANTTNVYTASAYGQANGAFDKANLDVTNISTTAGIYGANTIIPVFDLLANGRIRSVTNTTIRSATTTVSGIVQLNDTVTSTSTTIAGTANSVKVAFDKGQAAYNTANNYSTSATPNTYAYRNATGDVYANNLYANNLVSTSDIRFKNNIQNIDNPIDLLNSLNGVSFNWINTETKSYGLIAQELEKVMPELVSTTNDVKSVMYIPIIAILIEAIKQQQKEIEEIRNGKT